MGFDEDSEKVDNIELFNYLRIQLLLTRVGNGCLRQLFMKEWSNYNGKTWKNTMNDSRGYIESIGSNLYSNSQKIQQELLRNGDTNRWDTSLLVNAIKTFSITVLNMKLSERNQNLDILRLTRNKIAHNGKAAMSQTEFKENWSKAAKALLILGVPAKKLQEARENSIHTYQTNSKEVQLNPSNEKAKKLKDIGNDLFKKGQYTQAIENYTEASQLNDVPAQELAAIYSNRSACWLKLDNYESAKEDGRAAIIISPDWFKGYVRIANAYEKLGKYEKAFCNYNLALALNPTNKEIKSMADSCKCSLEKLRRKDHLDPQSHATNMNAVKQEFEALGLKFSETEINNAQRVSAIVGDAIGICGDGHRYLHGIGRKQDYEAAARCYSLAASKGSAEGLYNLGLLTKDGKGVQRDMNEAIKLFKQAAQQNPILQYASKVKIYNIGVYEAQHVLGLYHENGTGVNLDDNEAKLWYEKAIRNGSGGSANNLALMYTNGKFGYPNYKLAVSIWKLGSYYRNVRAMENLADYYKAIRDKENGWKWFNFSVKSGSISFPMEKQNFEAFLGKDKGQYKIDLDKFKKKLKQEVESDPLLENLLCKESIILSMVVGNVDSTNIPSSSSSKVSPESILNNQILGNEQDSYKFLLIRCHREGLKNTRRLYNSGSMKKCEQFTTEGNLVQSSISSLIGLSSISFKDMTATEDHLYDGYVILLTIIEDCTLGMPSIRIIVEDETKEVNRVFIYNHPLSKGGSNKELNEVFGYGSKISIVNPYWRIAKDGCAGIRVDDPSTIIIHSKNEKKCRFCGDDFKESVPCRKCRRSFYCSKKCLQNDLTILGHDLICTKTV